MPTQIFYQGLQVVSGQPTPLVGISDSSLLFGEKWATVQQVRLAGALTGCTFTNINNAKTNFEQIFASDFQPMLITQDGVTLYNEPYNRVVDINFASSLMVGAVNYVVTLETYPPELFSGFYGIINPTNEWSFTDTDNKLTEVTHRVSARGLVTSSGYSNAFDNAKNYVLGLTGVGSFVSPYFASYCTGANLCVDTFHESINRFENSYTVEERYIVDNFFGGAGYIRYQSAYNCDLNRGLATLDINGEVKSCKNANLAILRTKYNTFDVYSAAVDAYNDAAGRLDLNPTYLTSGVSEDNYTKKISFNVNFDNDWTPRVYFDYLTDIRISEDDITTVDIKGIIKGRGDLAARWQNVQNYYNTQLNLFNLAYQAYADFNNGSPLYILNPLQQNYSVTKNPFTAEISVATAYNNRDLLPVEFKDLDFTLNFKPAIEQLVSLPLVNLGSGSILNQFFYVQDMGFFNRAALELKGRAIGACSGNLAVTMAAVKNLANSYFLKYGRSNRAFLDKKDLDFSNDYVGNDLGFNFAWSFDAANPATIYPFSGVSTLSLN